MEIEVMGYSRIEVARTILPGLQREDHRKVDYRDVDVVYAMITRDKHHKLREGYDDIASLVNESEGAGGVYPFHVGSNGSISWARGNDSAVETSKVSSSNIQETVKLPPRVAGRRRERKRNKDLDEVESAVSNIPQENAPVDNTQDSIEAMPDTSPLTDDNIDPEAFDILRRKVLHGLDNLRKDIAGMAEKGACIYECPPACHFSSILRCQT